MHTAVSSLLIIVLCLALVSEAAANAAIPTGPLVWAAAPATTENLLLWIAANMFMCIGIEGAIYRYLNLFARPILASVTANFVSLVLGFPLILVGAIDPTGVLIPTVLSIFVEWLVLKRFQRPALAPASDALAIQRSILLPVLRSNVLTNFIMLGYLIWKYGLNP